MKLEPVIGLEIHVQLKTASKMFCGCSNRGEYEAPNVTVCPVCMGHPGTLPNVNAQAVRFGALIGLALGSQVAGRSKFDRKNYFYPDLPKGYQISQFDQPIVAGGTLEFEVPDVGNLKRTAKVRLTRVHLEEDAAKLMHSEDGKSSLVDYNRAGTPLAEIVTEPDFRSPLEAKLFLQELRLIMRYLGVSDADMEKGHLRCDANISLREVAEGPGERAPVLNAKTEVKNINSFRSVERALEYEIQRQTKLWLDGKPPTKQATRGWDDVRGITVEQRTKEGSSDYRYFPEPDLLTMNLDAIIEEMRPRVPELPAQRRARLVEEYGLAPADARTLVDDAPLADFAEKVFSELAAWIQSEQKGADLETLKPEMARLVSGWLLTKLNGVLTELKLTFEESKTDAENFAELLTLIHAKKVTGPNALVILTEMVRNGGDPSDIMNAQGLGAMSDTSELASVAANVIVANPKVVEDWRGGKANAIQFLVGQMMKMTKGKAPPEEARRLIEAELAKLK